MKSIFLAGAAMLTFATALSGPASAQDAPPPPAAGDATQSAPIPPPPPADPNAAQPTGAVPADTGMTPAPAGVPQDPAAPVGTSANPVTVGGNVTPPPAEAKDYPLCSKTVQDSCVNPSEAKRKGRR